MQAGLEPQTGIVIRPIGWRIWMIPPMVRVFIDGKCAGVLKDTNAATFPLSVGPHQVMVKRDFLRSETLDVSVRPGERAELEYGYHYLWGFWNSLFIFAMLFGQKVLTKIGLPVGPVIVAMGLLIVAYVLYVWKGCTTAGYMYYLRPRTVPPKPSAEDAPPASPTA